MFTSEKRKLVSDAGLTSEDKHSPSLIWQAQIFYLAIIVINDFVYLNTSVLKLLLFGDIADVVGCEFCYG